MSEKFCPTVPKMFAEGSLVLSCTGKLQLKGEKISPTSGNEDFWWLRVDIETSRPENPGTF